MGRSCQARSGSIVHEPFDPTFDPNIEYDADELGKSGIVSGQVAQMGLPCRYDVSEDDSPYPEVRCAVANFDDVNMPSSTVRAWVLGLIWSMVLPGVNQ